MTFTFEFKRVNFLQVCEMLSELSLKFRIKHYREDFIALEIVAATHNIWVLQEKLLESNIVYCKL